MLGSLHNALAHNEPQGSGKTKVTIKVAIRHQTEYRFDRSVGISPHLLRLRPAPHSRTQVSAYSLTVEPEEHFINWQQDPYNNYVARLVFPEPSRDLKFDVEVIAEMVAINPFDFFLEEEALDIPIEYEPALREDLAPYLRADEKGPLLQQWLREVNCQSQQTIDFLATLCQRLAADIEYVVRLEAGVQTCEQTLQANRGSCRDSAWLMVQLLRHLGLASRFVSGYLVQLVEDVKPLDGPPGPSADFADLHAWAEVYLPGAGWVGLDATSGLFAAEGHIPLAATPHFAQAAAITGSTGQCEVELIFSNTVTRIHEDPRVTLPYSEQQWSAINRLGHEVDARLDAADVRLTMGGEPTFVSSEDFESPQWTIAADGADKRTAAETLLGRLYKRFAAGGLVHRGDGKWYPGEPLPRWALNIFWRQDGEPLWQDPTLLAQMNKTAPPPPGMDQRFAAALGARLGLAHDAVQPAWEDTYYYLWKEGALPPDLDPADPRFKRDVERQRTLRLLDGDLTRAAGYVLPLAATENGWRGGRWQLRRGHIFLTPGDSPIGLRLPVDSLAAEDPRERPPPRDPTAPVTPLASAPAYRRPPPRAAADMADDEKSAPRTALCTEVRDNLLHVFLPPLEQAEAYVALVGAIEQTASDLGQSIVLEGYEPPRDARLTLLQITPDPGVIEVNVHPATDWPSMVENTDALYEEARRCHLTTEKFMLDGRHTGTGGGNHVTLGGPTPTDSPFLRRPHLLRSLITYIQNHPSLSYLFSGLFIGPTSQAPRIDEARDDRLHELAIALDQVPLDDAEAVPWLVDRVLRNQMIDLTGNTHRAEICLDKLYSPDHAGGRRGLVEFRAFEMPPHPQMSLAQMLLLRALTAKFWDQPYRHELIRWGTSLHDRYMLPWFVWEDFGSVIGDLQDSGYAFERDWYDAFFEFRFPDFGTIAAGGMTLNLRTALEPWHVLGEESTASGTARYVDSSLERLQVEVQGFATERYAVACNGYRVPLHPTGVAGNYVGGVRFKAWAPPSGMHPTIKAHGPLTFDLVDRFNTRAIGGCRYHVSHPGGLSYESYPVNAREAESRRRSRFEAMGHRPGPATVHDPGIAPTMPFTLDLRRCQPPACRPGERDAER